MKDYAAIRHKYIYISDANRKRILAYQKASILNVTLSIALLFMVIGYKEVLEPVYYESFFWKSAAIILLFGKTLFLYGLIWHVPKQFCLLFVFGKKVFLVNSLVSKQIAYILALFLPASVVITSIVFYPDMVIEKQLSIASVGILIVFVRMYANVHRYGAMEQFRKEYPPEYFRAIDDQDLVFW